MQSASARARTHTETPVRFIFASSANNLPQIFWRFVGKADGKSRASPRRQSMRHEKRICAPHRTFHVMTINTKKHQETPKTTFLQTKSCKKRIQRTAVLREGREAQLGADSCRHFVGNGEQLTFSLSRTIWSILSSFCRSSRSSPELSARYPSGQQLDADIFAPLDRDRGRFGSGGHTVRTAAASRSHWNAARSDQPRM